MIFSKEKNEKLKYMDQEMTNSRKIIIIATLIHISAIVYGIIIGYWDAVIWAIILLGSSLVYYFNKYKKDLE